jgi:hypothetical protein
MGRGAPVVDVRGHTVQGRPPLRHLGQRLAEPGAFQRLGTQLVHGPPCLGQAVAGQSDRRLDAPVPVGRASALRGRLQLRDDAGEALRPGVVDLPRHPLPAPRPRARALTIGVLAVQNIRSPKAITAAIAATCHIRVANGYQQKPAKRMTLQQTKRELSPNLSVRVPASGSRLRSDEPACAQRGTRADQRNALCANKEQQRARPGRPAVPALPGSGAAGVTGAEAEIAQREADADAPGAVTE